MEIRKVCSLKKLSLAGCRGGSAALSANTPLGYMERRALCLEVVVEAFVRVGGSAGSKLFAGRARGAGAGDDGAEETNVKVVTGAGGGRRRDRARCRKVRCGAVSCGGARGRIKARGCWWASNGRQRAAAKANDGGSGSAKNAKERWCRKIQIATAAGEEGAMARRR